MVKTTVQNKFLSIQERDDQFLSLFPHRYDYIWAVHPNPGAKPDWQTETRHPLSDRVIQQGSYLYGVRFGKETHYALLDIDTNSRYHPRQDPLAIDRIVHTLEPLGLVSHLTIQSSHSGGLHLYFPFEQAQPSWKIALAISTLLENAGFKLYPGQLEVFPNPRPYLVEGKPNLFNSHRLPLQIGSYLLDRDYQPVSYSQARFVEQWGYAIQRNDVETQSLDRLLHQLQRRCFKLSGKADKFLNDLNSEIEIGWTGYGQTNRLLGRIAMRAYVFHHVIHGGEPLTSDRLIQKIVKVAQSLPGYQDWCQHQHEIEHRASEWASCVESSHYFHYGDRPTKPTTVPIDATEPKLSWNQQRSEDARDRIKTAIADLLNQSALSIKTTDRFKQLLNYGIGGGSLYRHRDLWHPEFLNPELQDSDDIKTPPENCHMLTNLLEQNDGNNNSINTFNHFEETQSKVPDGNTPLYLPLANAPSGIDETTWLDVQATADTIARQNPSPIPSQKQLDRIQRFLHSDDPVLIAEANTWLKRHPEFVQPPPLTIDVVEAGDLSEQLALISIHIERLGWDKAQVRCQLQRRFGKAQQVQLNPAELTHWLTCLEDTP
jgi:hypothetical protein